MFGSGLILIIIIILVLLIIVYKKRQQDIPFTSNVSLTNDFLLNPLYSYLFIESLKNKVHLITDYHYTTNFTYCPDKYNMCIDFEPMNISKIKCDMLITSKKDTLLIPGCRSIFVPYFVICFMQMMDSIKPEMLIKQYNEQIFNEDRNFCCFVYSNCDIKKFKGVRDRHEFYKIMQRISNNRVDNLGRCLNDNYVDSGGWSNNFELLQNYKFVIAFENEQIDGYITEKMMSPMIARTVPIYLGAPDIKSYFNPNSFINVADFSSFEECIKYVLHVDRDPMLYTKYLNEPFLINNRVDKQALFSFYYGGSFYRQLTDILPSAIKPYVRTCMLFPNQIRMISFADGKVYNYHRIIKEAASSRYFKSYKGFLLKDFDLSFQKKHHLFINNNARGYGYWIWKPYLILTELSKLENDDILVYVDSGGNILSTVEGNQIIQELYQQLLQDEQKCMIIKEIPYKEETWIKMNCLFNIGEYYNMSLSSMKKLVFQTYPYQREATIMLFKKNDMSIRMLNDWYIIMNNYHNIDDSPSMIPNHDSFVEHRHDQSVLSVISKIYNANCIVKNDLYPIRRKGSCLELECQY